MKSKRKATIRKVAKDIKAIPNKDGGFISIGGNEFPKLSEVKVLNAPEGVSINVGLKTNVGGEITDTEVKDILKKEFSVDVVESSVQQSGTEPTLVAKLSRELTDDELYKLSQITLQDAIPQLSNGVGKMTNIGKESWGDFNPEYFLMGSNDEMVDYSDELGSIPKKDKDCIDDIIPTRTIPPEELPF